MQRIFQLTTYSLILVFMAVLAGCSGSSSTTTTSSISTGAITAKLTWAETSTAQAIKSAAPPGVATVRVIISGSAMTTMHQDFAASANTGTITNIPAGTGLTVTIQGLDATNTVTHQVIVNSISVTAGQTTNLGIITVLPYSKVGGTFPIISGYIGYSMAPNVNSFYLLSSIVAPKAPFVTNSAVNPPQPLSTSGLPFADVPLATGVASTGTGSYLVVWSEKDSSININYIMGRMLDSSGNPTGSPILIHSGAGLFNPYVAFDGTRFLVAWTEELFGPDDNIRGQFLTSSGSLSGSSFDIVASPTVMENSGSLIYAGSSYYIVYAAGTSGSNNYFIRSISTAGSISAAVQVNTTTSATWNPTAIAFDGTNILTTFHIATVVGGNPKVYGRLVSTSLTPLGSQLSFSATANSGFTGTTPAFDGSKYLVTWNEFGATDVTFYGQHLSTAGAMIGSPFVIATGGMGACSYITAQSQYLCLYNTYSTYTSDMRQIINNLNALRGVYVQP